MMYFQNKPLDVGSQNKTAPVMLSRIIEEFMAAKIQDRLNAKYLKQMEQILYHFKAKFPGPVATITTQQIDGWIRRGDHGVVTRNKWIVLFKDFFGYARQRG